MSYACTAATERGARCRNIAEPHGAWMCTQHNSLLAEGKDVLKAPLADTVLFKFNLNNRWRDKLLTLGVPMKARDVEAEEAKHVAHAEAFDREAYRYRDVADSGVPIFGKEGLQNVSLYEMLQELVTTYEVVDIHIKERRDGAKWMSVLVISFSHGQQAERNTEAFQELLSFLASSCWGYVHVWANPPQEDGRIIHTVNSSHREQDKTPELALHLAGGLWSSKPYAPPKAE